MGFSGCFDWFTNWSNKTGGKMINQINQNVVIGVAVIILNLIPLLTKKYKYLLITAILSIILMFGGSLF